jgi:hypothetical protein
LEARSPAPSPSQFRGQAVGDLMQLL